MKKLVFTVIMAAVELAMELLRRDKKTTILFLAVTTLTASILHFLLEMGGGASLLIGALIAFSAIALAFGRALMGVIRFVRA